MTFTCDGGEGASLAQNACSASCLQLPNEHCEERTDLSHTFGNRSRQVYDLQQVSSS